MGYQPGVERPDNPVLQMVYEQQDDQGGIEKPLVWNDYQDAMIRDIGEASHALL